jgi:hypothetical protein
VETSVNAFPINTGSKLVLIDTDASASSNHLSTVKPIPPKNRAFATAATLDEPSS